MSVQLSLFFKNLAGNQETKRLAEEIFAPVNVDAVLVKNEILYID